MCGIWLVLGNIRPLYQPKNWVKTLHARGPEATRIVSLSGDVTFGFTRLAINGLNPAGMQPFQKHGLSWMCNGEIYNHRALSNHHLFFENQSGSDCEILGPLYTIFKDNLASFFRSLDGVFALAIYDRERGQLIVGRDPYGVRPLFIGTKYACRPLNQPNLINIDIPYVGFASEMKALTPLCDAISQFPPGTYQVWDVATKKLIRAERYHNTPWLENPMYTPVHPNGLDMACASLRWALETAVEKRMLTERPVAALLSGGIDSSLIASLVQRRLMAVGAAPLKTFSVGMRGSSDLAYARKVADWIGSIHTEIVLSPTEFFKAIPNVIQAIETYDTTTVRASVGNWLVSREIAKRSDCKVVFNGDGSDEVFGSYLYFYKAPSDRAFEEESARLLEDIHFFDVLRSDRSISSHGLEPRTPFLDKQFVGIARSIATCWRKPIQGKQVEKWILRRAFDDGRTLPHEVLWRRKEAFSDGVSSQEKSWYQEIQDRVVEQIRPDWKEHTELAHSYMTPQTPEQYYYRILFEINYGKNHVQTNIPYFWMPKWSPGATDPSARTLDVY